MDQEKKYEGMKVWDLELLTPKDILVDIKKSIMRIDSQLESLDGERDEISEPVVEAIDLLQELEERVDEAWEAAGGSYDDPEWQTK